MKNSAEKEKSYRSAKVARGMTTKVIAFKASGSLEESRKTVGNVLWWQWKNRTNKHYCHHPKMDSTWNSILLFPITGKRTPNLRVNYLSLAFERKSFLDAYFAEFI